MWTLRGAALALILLVGYSAGNIFNVVTFDQGRYKIEYVTDGNLQSALGSIQDPSAVRELDLSANALTAVSASDFLAFRQLQQLNLSSNLLQGVVDLSQLGTVRSIDLNNNDIEEVKLGRSVEKLSAVNNHINRMHCDGSPKKLILANNKIGSVTSLILPCVNAVEHLDLSVNEIDTVDFGDLGEASGSLKHLDLSFNFIFDVRNSHDVIFSVLDMLDLSRNKISFVGVPFNVAQRAKSVNLSHNQIVMIDSKLKLTSHTTSLDLSGNVLQCASLKAFNDKYLNLRSTPRQCNPSDSPVSERRDCCEPLSAPFADRLIELKRREHSLLANPRDPKGRTTCQMDNESRSKKVETLRHRYQVPVKDAIRREQVKKRLEGEKGQYEQRIKTNQEATVKVREVLAEATRKQNITTDNTAEITSILADVIREYENQLAAEERRKHAAVKDWNLYQLQIDELEGENDRLSKLIAVQDSQIAEGNATYVELQSKQERLTKVLASRNAAEAQ
ncbi:transforming growth factor beta activator LRRC32-like [Anopheles cruzii]|uniref:transforming growth factor beta activator LRRC32-like n=1 Tax=Anopheles cruzii TaxID=68878 RepID=UPI0022EC63AB|nr:transforming growth factor beta activator LRRC32-like [Anopheles cruzii]